MAKLKNCKDCGKEISKKAQACPHCGAAKKKTSTFTWIITICIVLGIVGQLGDKSSPSSSTSSRNSEPKLEIVSWGCDTEHGYHTISGEVKNISDHKMDRVIAVGTFVTEDGDVVKTANGLVEYNPILAGQTSPFKVMTTHNPQIDTCKLSFKEMYGGQITTKDKNTK